MSGSEQAATPTDRWFRAVPDSSVLDRPRLLARSLIELAQLDERIAYFQRLLGTPADLRMPIPDFGGLELSAVGGLLLIASERPFTPIQRQTSYSLIVPHLDRQLAVVEAAGGTVLEPPGTIVPGSRARVRYPDGVLAELVEHRPRPGELPSPPAEPAADGMRLLARHAVPLALLDETVELYETLLDCPVAEQVRPDGYDVELVFIGGLLLVGMSGDEPSGDAARRPAFALLPRGGGPIGERQLLTLQGGTLAELWEGQTTDPETARRVASPWSSSSPSPA